MARLTPEEKATIEKSVRDTLKSLGLLERFRYSVRAVDTGGFVLVVAPLGSRNPLYCRSLTMGGRQCSLGPALGDIYCTLHRAMKDREDAGE